MTEDLVFGKKLSGYDYQTRKGIYAVIIHPVEWTVATVKTTMGNYFLPGGGTEGEENDGACLRREVLEETGYRIELLGYIGEVQQYFFTSAGQPQLSQARFYLVELGKKCQALYDALTHHRVPGTEVNSVHLFGQYSYCSVNCRFFIIKM
ncbi:8-oxo-dGTP diphosphatase [Evansella caseinilytica]|uniref:8-oxo-dGTP diphosphatase n=1 Tax=Evansella caseinilytica TaxID=1503961 RepID=A0A1H3HD32_9BACI|nr:NUDIX domain-containing protein [Evansella caseinilytica]SDY12559.1 8-oxo-dGTP diphosphatase [Evansella caseinilytica]